MGFNVIDAIKKMFVKKSEVVEPVTDRGDRREEFPVTKDLWQITPMPEKNTQFTIKRKFTDAEIHRIKLGHLPAEMEDRWFSYYEDGKVYYHRSWSGCCIYIVELNLKKNKHIVTVNRDEREYTNTDINEDIELINELFYL